MDKKPCPKCGGPVYAHEEDRGPALRIVLIIAVFTIILAALIGEFGQIDLSQSAQNLTFTVQLPTSSGSKNQYDLIGMKLLGVIHGRNYQRVPLAKG